MSKNYVKIISWSAVIIWMAVIFRLSSQVAVQSDHLSIGIAEFIVRAIQKIIPGGNFDLGFLNHIIRKCSHFMAYLILGILSLNALRRNGGREYKDIVVTLLISVLYAASDEIHQMFVPGRGPAVTDVLIDSMGACIGICMYVLVARMTRNIKFDKDKSDLL